jgi:hypothetical protein
MRESQHGYDESQEDAYFLTAGKKTYQCWDPTLIPTHADQVEPATPYIQTSRFLREGDTIEGWDVKTLYASDKGHQMLIEALRRYNVV